MTNTARLLFGDSIAWTIEAITLEALRAGGTREAFASACLQVRGVSRFLIRAIDSPHCRIAMNNELARLARMRDDDALRESVVAAWLAGLKQ